MKYNRRPDALVCVLKTRRDLGILLEQKWYRVPLSRAPRRKPKYLAFYQAANFGADGKRIRFYGRVKFWRLKKRNELLPEEKNNPRAEDLYIQFVLSGISQLRRPVKNRRGIRISFGFTSLEKLRHSKSVRGLYGIPSIENIVAGILGKNKIAFYRELRVKRRGGKFYRLDFALPARRGLIDLECDGYRWHSQRRQRLEDRHRNAELKKLGWKVLRIKEDEIVSRPAAALGRVRHKLRALGGSQPELPLKFRN